uniref:FAD-binding FR-type domain-containing protein n=1 Tax=uncultured bacterium fosmid pJB39A3 TaxID=1478063 RepID=A0A0H3U7Q2_9BACT|nr:hypothetical protein [uncultured bacterium fosmid pJB39A3]
MAKYDYDKADLKGLGISAFMDQVKTRQKKIEAADAVHPQSVYNANRLAAGLHPDVLIGRISKVMDMGATKNYVIEPLKEAGCTEFPPFYTGQYASFEFDLGNSYTSRTYSITWAPKELSGPDCNSYMISVSDHGPGHMSEYIHNNWAEGTVVRFCAPLGRMFYEPLRDANNIMTLGIGGEGLPLAMAAANGIEEYNITAVSTAPSTEELMGIRPIFEATAARSQGRVVFVPVLLDGEAPGCEKGPVTAELIKKYITDTETGELKDTSFFVTGMETHVFAVVKELEKLGIPKRRIRTEIHGEHPDICADDEYPKDRAGKIFNLRIWFRDKYIDTVCPSDKTLQRAIEDANIHVQTHCRSGECGWCHSRIIKGEYYVPFGHDGRRQADRKFGWIHPCSTYPLSNIEMEVFPSL